MGWLFGWKRAGTVSYEEKLRQEYEQKRRKKKDALEANTASLPSYEDGSTCPKCRAISFREEYQPQVIGDWWTACHFEHIRRKCVGCGYAWGVKPQDWRPAPTLR